MLVEVMSCGKNALSVLREWKKPYIKTPMLHDVHIVIRQHDFVYSVYNGTIKDFKRMIILTYS